MTTILVLSVYVLAVARLTRLINVDIILDRLRVRVARKWGAASTPVYFLGCVWCVGMWLSLIVAIPLVGYLHWPEWTFVPLGLACSHVVGLLARLDDEDIGIETVDSAS